MTVGGETPRLAARPPTLEGSEKGVRDEPDHACRACGDPHYVNGLQQGRPLGLPRHELRLHLSQVDLTSMVDQHPKPKPQGPPQPQPKPAEPVKPADK